jgi:hypothetical protein
MKIVNRALGINFFRYIKFRDKLHDLQKHCYLKIAQETQVWQGSPVDRSRKQKKIKFVCEPDLHFNPPSNHRPPSMQKHLQFCEMSKKTDRSSKV